jgi:hypothetical protein
MEPASDSLYVFRAKPDFELKGRSPATPDADFYWAHYFPVWFGRAC